MPSSKIWFAGTPELASNLFSSLLEHYPIELALTAPDRPKGRGRKIAFSPVKEIALQHQVPLLQPQTLKDPSVFSDHVANIEDSESRPDILIVAAYGLLLPQYLLDLPKLGCLNVHYSLLPRWRGASPITQAILHNDKQTGVTLMKMDRGLDTGPMYSQSTLELSGHETTGSLTESLTVQGSEFLLQQLPGILSGTLQAKPQPEQDITHAPKIAKQEALVNWSLPAEEIERAIRAYTPWPTSFSYLRERRLRLLTGKAIPRPANPDYKSVPGTVHKVTKDHVWVEAGQESCLVIEKAQWDGGKPLPVKDLLLASQHPFIPGAQFTGSPN